MTEPYGFTKVYRRYARFYNIYFGKVMNPGRIKAVEIARCQAGEKVLEVGVGTGLSLPFYPKDVRVTGIDLSPEMLKRAKELVKEEELTHVENLEIMDAENMKFADNQFDCVMAMHVSTVVSHPDRFAAEMKRVCKPSGRIIIVNYFHDSSTFMGRISHTIAPYARYLGFRPDLTLEEFLHQTGLEVSENIPVNLFNEWSILVIKNKK